MGPGTKIDARGFTLLELFVVLFVLALGAVLAAPTIGRGTDAIKVRAEIAGFSALLRHARESAITSGRRHAVIVDPEAHRATLIAGEDEVKRTRAIPPGWTIEGDPPPNLTTRFEPQGSSSGGLYRVTAAGLTYRITIDAVTGRVRSIRE